MAIDRIERLSMDQKGYRSNKIAIDRTERESIQKEMKYIYNLIYVAKKRNCDIFVVKIYYYGLIDSF